MKYCFLIFFISMCILISSCLNAQEIGNLRYKELDGIWGTRADDYTFACVGVGNVDFNLGHVTIFVGTDEEDNDWYIESYEPDGVSMNKDADRPPSGNPCKLDPRSFDLEEGLTKEIRKKLISLLYSRIGALYPMPKFQNFELLCPTLRQQKGMASWEGSLRYTCVGLAESSYEIVRTPAGSETRHYGITPDGWGRNLVFDKDKDWTEGEASYVKINFMDSGNLAEGWVLFPYTQLFKQIHEYAPRLDKYRLKSNNGEPPTVNFITLNPKEIEPETGYGEGVIEVVVSAEDGAKGSGIFKVELYHSEVKKENLLKNHKLSVNSPTEIPISREELTSAKLYTYADPPGSTKPIQDCLYDGTKIKAVFYYKDESVPIELEQYKFDWNTMQAVDSTPENPKDVILPDEELFYTGSEIKEGSKVKLIAKAWDRAGHTSTAEYNDFIIDNFLPRIIFKTA